MLITVSGPPGSGTSTLSTAIADEFGLDHVNGGDAFCALADERGYTLEEFNRVVESTPEVDRDIDRRLRRFARERDDLVLESRLAGWLAAEEAELRIRLDAPFALRAERVADREDVSVEQASEDLRARERSERKRYADLYGVDDADASVYDLLVDTARWDEEATISLVTTAVRNHAPQTDDLRTDDRLSLD